MRQGSLLHQDGSVGPVLTGLAAHHTQQLAVVLTVVVQLFLVTLTQLYVLWLSGQLSRLPARVHLQPLDVLHQTGELPHGPDVLLLERLLAERTHRAAPGYGADITCAAAAEDVATVDGHGVP